MGEEGEPLFTPLLNPTPTCDSPWKASEASLCLSPVSGCNDGTYSVIVHSNDSQGPGSVPPTGQAGEGEAREEGVPPPKPHGEPGLAATSAAQPQCVRISFPTGAMERMLT